MDSIRKKLHNVPIIGVIQIISFNKKRYTHNKCSDIQGNYGGLGSIAGVDSGSQNKKNRLSTIIEIIKFFFIIQRTFFIFLDAELVEGVQ